MTDAVAYLRTSSAGNVGSDKDSDKRQRAAIEAFAKVHAYSVVVEFYDAAVSGADPIADRPGTASRTTPRRSVMLSADRLICGRRSRLARTSKRLPVLPVLDAL